MDKLAHDASQTKARKYVLGVIVLPVTTGPLVIPYVYHQSEYTLESKEQVWTRTVLFPSLWGGFFVNITWLYLLPCGLKLLLLGNDCLCSWGLYLSFGVACTHRVV